MNKKKETWKVVDHGYDKGRYVINQDDVLIADCYASTTANLGLPANYRKLAKRIVLLPQLEQALRDVYDAIPWGHPAHTRAAGLLDKLDKLRPK
jgi:hypothetical protein